MQKIEYETDIGVNQRLTWVSRKRALPRVDNSERKESFILSRASVVESPPDAKPPAR